MTDEIISDRQAYAQGLKFYFTGRPCKRGHIAKRNLRTGLCVECVALKTLKKTRPNRKKYTPDERKAARAAYDAAYHVRNRERINAYKRANPDKRKAARNNAIAKRRGAEGKYTPADIRRILKSQKGRCAYCRTVIGAHRHIDHIVPLAKGGTNWPRNLQILCPSCNLAKHARDPITHARSLGLLL